MRKFNFGQFARHRARNVILGLWFGVLVMSVRASEPDWSVEGEWVETCTCKIPCPCWNEKPAVPSFKDCPDMQYFHVSKGHYGATSLDGLDVIQVAVSADNENFGSSADAKDMKLDNLYLPRNVSAAVADAAEKIFAQICFIPLDASKMHSIKRVELRATLANDELKVSIPGILEADVILVKDNDGQPVKFPYDVTVIPYLKPGLQGRSQKYWFNDEGLSWNVSGRNGTWARFAYDSARGPLPWSPGYTAPTK